jgi:predicted amidohydrolase
MFASIDPSVGGVDGVGGRRLLSVLALQLEPTDPAGSQYEDAIRRHLSMSPHAQLVVLPELHVHSDMKLRPPTDLATELDGPLVTRLRDVARRLRVWMVPGSFYERDGNRVHNTALAISPAGDVVAAYRKCFPWRPFEETTPGTSFVVFDIPGTGRVGISICYDTWFPELARHLAWMGAEVIVQPTATYTADREQELVLARATAIVNQLFVVSVNAAAPSGTGHSLIVDPEGHVRAEAGELPLALCETLDLSRVWDVRRNGTAGVTRVWQQFRPGDPDLELPLYGGRLHGDVWWPTAAHSEGTRPLTSA